MTSSFKSDLVRGSHYGLILGDIAVVSFVKLFFFFLIKVLLTIRVINGLHAVWLAITNCVIKLMSDILPFLLYTHLVFHPSK